MASRIDLPERGKTILHGCTVVSARWMDETVGEPDSAALALLIDMDDDPCMRVVELFWDGSDHLGWMEIADFRCDSIVEAVEYYIERGGK